MCWTYISRKAVFSRVWFQIAYKVTWNSWMDLESGAVGKNKLSEKTLPSLCSGRTLALCSICAACQYMFLGSFHNEFLLSHGRHRKIQGTSLICLTRGHKLLSLSRSLPGDTVVYSVLWRLHLTTQKVIFSHFSRNKLEIHEKTCSYLKDPQKKEGLQPQKNTSNARCSTNHPCPQTRRGSFRCHSLDRGTKQLSQQDVAHHQTEGWRGAEIVATNGHKSTKPRWKCEAKASGLYTLG